MRKLPRILFFIAAAMPTPEEFDAADELGPNVAFRNASLVTGEGSLEECDGVAGVVPKAYAAKYPTAREAIEKWQVEEMERRQRRAAGIREPIEGETAAPQAATTPPGNAKAAPKGNAAVKEPTPAPAAAAGWKANS